MPSHNGYYECSTVPKPHSEFEYYFIQATEKHGICLIKGIGKDISDNGFGFSTKTRTDEMAETLSKKYGKAEHEDVIFPGSIWDEPNDWMRSIVRKERLYYYKWDVSSEFKPLSLILLSAKATSGSIGYIVLEYYATFHEDCDAVLESAEDDAL